MSKNLALWFLVVIGLGACKNSETESTKPENTALPKSEGAVYMETCDSLRQEARRMDSLLLQESDVVRTTANQAILAFTGFAIHCVSDSMCPVYLIKTAQVARVINNIPQAKAALDRCIDMYPDFKDRPAAIFLLAQLYDEATYLNNEEEARKWYNKIIEEYPKSEWVPTAKAAIKLLGKTDEDIIREFTRKKTTAKQ